nr:MAG TPA: hypothetical protein [Caudoviricetes sp.]
MSYKFYPALFFLTHLYFTSLCIYNAIRCTICQYILFISLIFFHSSIVPQQGHL